MPRLLPVRKLLRGPKDVAPLGGANIPSPLTYLSVNRDDFSALSLRTGGPTPAGFAAGKGRYADCGLYYRDGLGNNAKGFASFGFGAFVDHGYNWQAVDPNYPPLGQLDIQGDGLHIIGGSNFPLIRAQLPGINIMSPPGTGGGWFNAQGGTFTTGSSVDGLPIPAVIAAGGGNQTARREFFRSNAFKAGETVRVVIKWNYGTSNSLYLLTATSSGASSGTVFGNTFTQGATAAGSYSNVTISDVGSHKELSFNLTLAADSYIDFACGPNSTTAGQNVIVYDMQTLRAPYLAGIVTDLYSCGIKPPFYRETVLTMPGGNNDFSADWMLGADTSLGQQEIDIIEWFGTSFPNDQIVSNLHTPQGSQGSNYRTGTSLVGRQITVGVQVLENSVIYYYGGRGGVAYAKVPVPSGANWKNQYFYTLLDEDIGFAATGMPQSLAAASHLIVRSVEYFAPPSNTSFYFPPAAPVPVTAWGGGYPGGAMPASIADGTIVAALSGAAGGYSVLGTSKLAVSGTNLVTVGTQSAGSINFYIQGTDAGGNPGIAPKLTATFT
ncbi:hypothetical protein [Bradyrhizobium yuanmingense]|uniref:hypothetical protein n=1 Tax=Bradyrhizobium yuanmingense TaxID=108015 RepID=UPI0004B4FEB9|nr:hypothetical protein [Bradyrhizobium yuanmingense]